MKAMKQAAILAFTTEELQAEIGKFEATYNSSAIEFKNSKGVAISCPANLIDGFGRFTGDKASDKPSFDLYMSTYLKVRHEQSKGDGTASVSSGKETLTIRTTVKGVEHKKAPVATQWEAVQALAKTVKRLREELNDRTVVAARAKVNADMAAYVASLCAPVTA